MRILIVISAVLFSLSSQAEMGFFKLAEAPEAIQKVAPSVVQVLMPEGQIVRRYKLSDYETPEFVAELEAMKNVHLRSQMKFCRDNKLDLCLVYNGFAISSGFIVRNSHHVATNRHVVWSNLRDLIREYVKLGETYEAAFQKAIARPFIIKVARNLKRIKEGHRQIEALEWYQNEALISLAMIGEPGFAPFIGSDILVIKTENDLGLPPVQFATKPAPIGSNVYILGFPQATTNRKPSFGKGEANGIREISISKGVALTAKESLLRLSAMNSKIRAAHDKYVADPAFAKHWDDNVFFTDADSDQGSSGGPVVNEQGEVVAIQCARLIEYRGVEPGVTITFASLLIRDFVQTSPLRLVPQASNASR